MDKMFLKGLIYLAGLLGAISSIISYFNFVFLGMQFNWLTIFVNNSSALTTAQKDAYNTGLLVLSALTILIGSLIKKEEHSHGRHGKRSSKRKN